MIAGIGGPDPGRHPAPDVPPDIDAALRRAEDATAERRGLAGTGFWAAVSVVRRDARLAEHYADRIASIDRRAFEQAMRWRVTVGLGNALLLAVTIVGLLAVGFAYGLEGVPQAIAVLGGTGVLLGSTHAPAHWAVGRLVGIRFTHYFVGGRPQPGPGAKIDYASYLRTPPRARALMHASGAFVTKLVPFVVSGAAWAMGAHAAVIWTLLVLGVVQLVSDAALSTTTSDWMKVRRELGAARHWS